MGKKKPPEREYIVVVDNSGEDAPTEVFRATSKEISNYPHRKFFTIIRGEVLKGFDNETFDFSSL